MPPSSIFIVYLSRDADEVKMRRFCSLINLKMLVQAETEVGGSEDGHMTKIRMKDSARILHKTLHTWGYEKKQ